MSAGMQPRCVAYLTESFALGGVERSTALLIRNIDRELYRPLLFCANEASIEPFVAEVKAVDVPVIQTGLLSSQRRNWNPLRILALSRLFRRYRIDILHIQLLGGTGARYVVLAARLARIPVVIVTVRGAALKTLSGGSRLISRLLDGMVTLYTTASRDNRLLQIRNVGRRPDQVRMIYNAIDVAGFDPNLDRTSARRNLGVAGQGPLIGTMGRLDPQKGIEYFLEMAASVQAAVPDACFVVIGEGEARARYEQIVRGKNMQGYVSFTGYRGDTARCLAALDVFVLASTFEPFGLVLTEAMAMERPVVASRVGGIPEVVKGGETGTLVAPHNAQALAQAVLRYLSDPHLARRHGRAGRQRVLQHFSLTRLKRDVETMYDSLLRERYSAGHALAADLPQAKDYH